MSPKAAGSTPLKTPDGRYIVVRGRLWRTANPHLPPQARQALVDQLMAARRAVRAALKAADAEQLAAARRQVQTAKVGLRAGPQSAYGPQYALCRVVRQNQGVAVPVTFQPC